MTGKLGNVSGKFSCKCKELFLFMIISLIMVVRLTIWDLILKRLQQVKKLISLKPLHTTVKKTAVVIVRGNHWHANASLGTSSFVLLSGTRKRGNHKDKMSWIISHVEHHVLNPVKFPQFS
jgi:hypothetical protein